MTKAESRKPKAEGRRAVGTSPRELRAHPTVRNYTLFCLTALFLLVVCLVDRGLGWWCLMPALIGGVALLAHWSFGPAMAIVSVTGLLLSSTRYRWGYPYWARNQAPTLMDLILCVAVLGYVMGQYRLLSLMRRIFPPDPRHARIGERKDTIHDARSTIHERADTAKRRSPDLVSSREIVLVVLALPLWTGFSVIIWGWMMETGPALDMPIEAWRALRVVWVVLAVLATTAAVAGYVRTTMATPEEGLMYLQDQLWRPTRREQGSLNRWLLWARLRAQRRRETS